MRWFFSLLGFLIYLLCPGSASAELPEISTAIETQLYRGTPEEIRAFIAKRQALVDELVSQVNGDIGATRIESEKTAWVAVLDELQSLSFQLKNLGAELDRPALPAMSLPGVDSPPYGLSVFDDLVAFRQKVERQQADYQEKLVAGNEKLATLKAELGTLLPLYIKGKTEDAGKIGSLERLVRLFGLQNEYALVQLRKVKLEKELAETANVVREIGALIARVFDGLQIGQEDIAALKKRQDQLTDELANKQARLTAESLELSKREMKVEAQLDRAITTLAQTMQHGGDGTAEEVERDLRELELAAIGFRQRAIGNEKLNLELRAKGQMFRLAWLEACVQMDRGGKPGAFVEIWQKTMDELRDRKDELVRDLSLSIQQRSDHGRWVSTVTQKLEGRGSTDVRLAVARQVERTTREQEQLISDIADNVHDIDRLRDEIGLLLKLMSGKLSAAERFFTLALAWTGEKWERVTLVLYYPLFTVGEISITLISCIKVLVMVWIGLRVLKVIRRKTATILTAKTAMSPGAVNSLTTLIYYAALVYGGLTVLSIIGFNVSQMGMVFGALGVGIGFGLQTIFNNFVSGIILLTEQSIQVGDYVQLQTGVDGEVRKISIRATIVRTFDGEDVIVPNSEFVSSRVNTWSYGDNWRRLKIPFGVSYNADPDQVVRLAMEAAREVSLTKEDASHPLRVFFEGFGNNSLDFSIRPWCWMKRGHSGMLSEYYFVLYRKLKAAGIEIPFPQTDLHLKSISPEMLAALQKIGPMARGEEPASHSKPLS